MSQLATTLSALLAHRSMHQVDLLTDLAAGQVEVTRVALLADVSQRPEEVHGALVVVLSPAPRSDWRWDALLSHAFAARAAAVLVPGTMPLEPSTRRLADRLGLPVAGAADALGAYAAAAALIERPAREAARVVLTAVEACRHAGAASEDVIVAAARALDREVDLIDQAGHVVIGSDSLADEDRTGLLRHLSQASQLSNAPILVEVRPAYHVVLLRMAGVGQTSWLCAHLVDSLPAERAAIEAALPVVAGALQERLALHRLQLERIARSRTSLLDELLRNPSDVSKVIRSRTLSLGWDLDGWHVGVYIGVFGEVDLMGVRGELISAFHAQSLSVEAVEQSNGWAVWATANSEPSAEDAVRQTTAIRRAQRQLNSAVPTYVGVGRARAGPQGIARSLAEARDAARLAKSREETGRFLHVDRLGFGQLLLGWTRTDSFLPAANALLAPLTGAPGDLIGTLRAYLDCESSVAHTAAVLGVHRNTIAARMSKIQQLLAVDLSNPDERLALHLACKTVGPLGEDPLGTTDHS
jgi:purine catabolism regulator